MKKNKRKTQSKTKGFWGTMWKALKEAKAQYKAKMREEAEYRRLLSSHSDWSMIEELVKQVNSNPNLKIRVTLYDGTLISLSTYQEVKVKDYQLLDL